MDWSGAILLVAGWFLNEMAKKFQMNRERRGHIGRALSNLLELHHQIRSVENTIQYLVQHFDLPVDTEHVLRPVLQQVVPQGDECIARYADAIEQLSESDPITAFDLRTKGQITRLLTLVQSMATLQGVSNMEMSFMEKQLREVLMPSLVTAIRELAQLHGSSSKRKVNAYLDAPFQMPEEAQAMLHNIKAESQKRAVEQGAATQ